MSRDYSTNDVADFLTANEIEFDWQWHGKGPGQATIECTVLGGFNGRTAIRITFADCDEDSEFAGVEWRETSDYGYDSGAVDCDKELREVLRIK